MALILLSLAGFIGFIGFIGWLYKMQMVNRTPTSITTKLNASMFSFYPPPESGAVNDTQPHAGAAFA
jgi:hypothetical protein